MPEVEGFGGDRLRIPHHGNRSQTQGGLLRDVVIDLAGGDEPQRRRIPRDNSNDFNPMWVGDRIYFLSDRNGPITLFAYEVVTKRVSELIHNPGSDILAASAGPGAIVYARFGALHLYDLTSGKVSPLRIRVSGDMPETKPRSVKALDNIADVKLSPAGDRVLIEARGEMMTVTAGQGEMQNLTNTPGVRERFPAWSPDAKRIAYSSDESGEYVLHIRNSDGTGDVKRIVLGNPPGFYFSPVWSPDSKKIAYRDHRLSLWYVNVDEGNPVRIDADAYQKRTWTRIEAPPPAWSPDSQWLSYTRMLANHMRALCIYSLETGQSRQVTGGLSDIRSPQFDRSGSYLYFTSSTDIGPSLGDDLSACDRVPTRSVYVAFLRRGLKFPTTPEAEAAGPVAIDFDRLEDRITALPIPTRNYAKLIAGKPGVLFLVETVAQRQTALPGRSPSANPQNLYRFDLAAKKADKILEGVRDLDVSRDGEKVLYKQGEEWRISLSAVPPKPGEGVLILESLQITVEPVAEWRQMYREVWRSERDFFYDPGFHGLDLKTREKKFEPYLASVASPADVNYLFQEMLSELRVSHLYANAGTGQREKTAGTGLLGADYELVGDRYRFARIYAGDRWDPDVRAPLVQPGLDVKEGDYLLAVDGQELRASDDIYRFFVGNAEKEVVLRISSDAAGAQAREVTVVPIEYDWDLRQFAWVEENRRKVDKLTSGSGKHVAIERCLRPACCGWPFRREIRNWRPRTSVRATGHWARAGEW